MCPEMRVRPPRSRHARMTASPITAAGGCHGRASRAGGWRTGIASPSSGSICAQCRDSSGCRAFMWRSALEDVAGWLGAVVARRELGRIEREVMLAYFAGYFAARMKGGDGQGTSGAGTPIVAPAPRPTHAERRIPGLKNQ